MVTLSPASIVVIPFPFSDLSGAKLRPAIVLLETGHNDWLLCQITSNPDIDPSAMMLTDSNLATGTLNRTSYARPLKLFTANTDLIVKRVAILNDETFHLVIQEIVTALTNNLPG